VLRLNRHQAWEIALRIAVETGMGIGNATVCRIAEEHLDGAISMDRTMGEDHHGFHSPDSASEATYLGIGPKDQGKIGPLTESVATPRTDVFVVRTTYGEYPMTKPMLSAIRWIDVDASLGSPCSWCRHSEFVHTESGPCLFSECKCPRFFPMVESAPPGEPAGESAA
jgi:hypothetical protein